MYIRWVEIDKIKLGKNEIKMKYLFFELILKGEYVNILVFGSKRIRRHLVFDIMA